MLEVRVALVEGTPLLAVYFSLIVGLIVDETLRLVHESFAIVALRVLLHSHH